MLACATALTDEAWSGLPQLSIQARAAERTPVQRVARPLLMALTRGRVRLHARGSRDGETHGAGMVTLVPSDADDEGVHWSTPAGAAYIGIELPTATCEGWLKRTSAWSRNGERVVRFQDTRVLHWAGELRAHVAAAEPFGALYTQSVSMALVAYLDARLRGPAAPQRASTLAPRHLARVVEYVDAHLAQPLRILDLAALCGYGPQHFTRLFRAATGSSVHAWVLARRIAQAQHLLAGSGEQPIAEIALACGFSSQSHLHAAFKARCGQTPGAFRRTWSAAGEDPR